MDTQWDLSGFQYLQVNENRTNVNISPTYLLLLLLKISVALNHRL